MATGSWDATSSASQVNSGSTSLLSSPSSPTVVKHGQCLLTLKKNPGFRNQCLRKLLCISYMEYKANYWVWSKILLWQLSRDGHLHGLSSPHATTASPKPSFRHLGGWSTSWSAEEMLDEQHQRVDIPAHASTAHNGLLRKRLEEDLC